MHEPRVRALEAGDDPEERRLPRPGRAEEREELALLAFALSFDEIVVTTFTSGPGIQTLPQWVFNNLFRPNQSPIVNAVAALLIILFVAPVYLAQRFSEAETGGRI